MERIDDLEAFLAIVEKGSQTTAARHLGRSLQSVNRSLSALEQSVGVPLIQRTTRRSGPTDAGLSFYERIKPAVAVIREAKRDAVAGRSEPSGLLRIGAPVLFAPAYVAPAVCDFMARHPQVEIELVASDRQPDLMEDGLDLAIRIRELPDSSFKVRRLGELRLVVFATPDYLARKGHPRHPDALLEHQCVVRVDDTGSEAWPFRVEGERRYVRVTGRFRTDSAAAAIAAVEQGHGLGRAPLWQVRGMVDRGVVEVVLEDFEVEKLPIQAVLPPARVLAKTRLFLDLLALRLKRERF